MEKSYLVNNRMIKRQDYEKTFNVSHPTAKRLMMADIEDFKFRRYMVSHFYAIYNTYPKGFKPVVASLVVNS